MKDIFIISKFTIKEMVKRKSFIISTLIILLLIVLGCNIPNIMNSLNKEDESLSTILISDKDNVFGNTLNLDMYKEQYKITITQDDLTTIKDKINNDEYDEALLITKTDNGYNIDHIVKSISISYMLPEDIISSLQSIYHTNKLIENDFPIEKIGETYPLVETNVIQSSTELEGNIFTTMLMSVVLFFAVYFCALQVSSSITTEKTSKIIETLVTSTSPTNIIVGKTLGIGLVGLCQVIIIFLTALCSAYSFLDKELIEMVFDPSSITLGLGIIIVIYFLLGYFTYAFIYALTGSTVSKPEDIQSANTPVALIGVAGFYLAYFTMMNPSSSLNKLAAYLPISSPFCMPLRYMIGLAPIKEVLLSILFLLLTMIVIAYIAIKVYKNAILNYGSRLSIKDMIKFFKQK